MVIKLSTIKNITELLTLNNIDNNMTEKQINILSAAIELFSEKGYEATATSEIAKKANVAEGTIFRYYKTKKDLLLAIPTVLSKTSLVEIFVSDFDKVLNDKHENFEAFLRRIVLNRKEFASKTAPILKVVVQEIPFHPELRSRLIKTVILPMVRKHISIIDKFKEQGELINIPSASIIRLVATSIFGYFFVHYIALPELTTKEEDLEYLIQYIMNGVSKKNASK